MLALSVTVMRDVDSVIVHDIDLDLCNGPRSNVNMPMESRYATIFVGNCNVCPICHRLQEIHNGNVHDLDHDL